VPLRKFIETSRNGALTGRIAYVVSDTLLPAAGEGALWREQRTFSEAAEKNDAGVGTIGSMKERRSALSGERVGFLAARAGLFDDPTGFIR
jgi:hypothetical protein